MRRRVGERKGHEVSRDELMLLVEMNDATTTEVVDSAGRKLGLAVANVITLLNPELLVICGEGTALGATYLDPIVNAVREQTFADLGRAGRDQGAALGRRGLGRRCRHVSVARVVQPARRRRQEPRDLAPGQRCQRLRRHSFRGRDVTDERDRVPGSAQRRRHPSQSERRTAPSSRHPISPSTTTAGFATDPSAPSRWISRGEHEASARYHAWVNDAVDRDRRRDRPGHRRARARRDLDTLDDAAGAFRARRHDRRRRLAELSDRRLRHVAVVARTSTSTSHGRSGVPPAWLDVGRRWRTILRRSR